MKKIYMQDKIIRGAKLINRSTCGEVYKLRNGDILKLFSPVILQILNHDYSLERKIMSAKPIESVPEIITPNRVVLNRQNRFVGYTMPPAPGIDFNTYDQNFTNEQRSDLKGYSEVFYSLSSAVERANKQGIIMPDLCTCDNIFIDGGKISIIDYDGFQVGKHKAYTISTTLGPELQYHRPKYMNGDYFTPEIDKKGLVLLYFLNTYNINLNRIGQLDPMTGKPISLYEVFELLGLQDYDLMQKVYNTLSNDKPGEYIAEDVMRVSEEYTMQTYGNPRSGFCFKKLFKK